MNSVKLAKFVMKRFENVPATPDEKIGSLEEVFRHPLFVQGSEDQKKQLMMESSSASHKTEMAYPWDHFFNLDLRPLLKGKRALDLGCFNGGRGVAMFQRYQLKSLVGLDIDPTYIEAATQFAESQNVPAEFSLGAAESLPFDDDSFDAVFSYEVFEHLRDPRQALAECYRVVKPGGRMFVIFPSYYHPTGHHLGLATKAPFINCLFSGRTLVNAYCELIDERGNEAEWYKRSSPELKPWEKSNTINGTTLGRFERYVQQSNWNVYLQRCLPLGRVGRNVSKKRSRRALSYLLQPLVHVPCVREAFVHRITFILEK